MDRLNVFAGDGEVAFQIAIPEGCVIADGKEIDPRQTIFTAKYTRISIPLQACGTRRGLNGERIDFYKVDGGDIVRHIQPDPVDDYLYRQFVERFHRPFWDVYEMKFDASHAPPPNAPTNPLNIN